MSNDRLYADALSAALGLHEDFLTWPRTLGSSPLTADGTAPNVVLVDATMESERVIQELWRLQELVPKARLVVFGLEDEGELLLSFIEAGASAYALRHCSPRELAEMLRELENGGVVCSQAMLSLVVTRITDLVNHQPRPPAGAAQPLTLREHEVLREMASGLRNKEIGRRLSITVQTVKNHVHSVLEKLGVHRRREAVRRALELGWIDERINPGKR